MAEPAVTWVLQNNVMGEKGVDRMVAHLHRTKTPHFIVEVMPFTHDLRDEIRDLTGPVVVYGTTAMREVSERHGWQPGVWGGDFTCQAYKDALGGLFLNGDGLRAPLSELPAAAGKIDAGHLFVRPLDDEKGFPGRVLSRADVGSFSAWTSDATGVGPEAMVWAAAAKPIYTEFRAIVVNREIVAGSSYRRSGRVFRLPGLSECARKAARKAISLYDPAPVYVIDVAEMHDGCRVIEYGRFNFAGLYECRIEDVVDGINGYLGDVAA